MKHSHISYLFYRKNYVYVYILYLKILSGYATRDIDVGDEIRYDYQDESAWWRQASLVIFNID